MASATLPKETAPRVAHYLGCIDAGLYHHAARAKRSVSGKGTSRQLCWVSAAQPGINNTDSITHLAYCQRATC